MIPLLLLVGCGADGSPYADPCAAEFVDDTLDPGVRSAQTQLQDDAGDWALHVQLRWPATGTGPWPVAVVLHGGWNQQGTPVDAGTSRLDPAEGVAEIHLDLPGNGLSGGVNDRRGAGSRAAVARALRWAAGLDTDLGGCTAARRAVGADPDALYLVGASNGGNLAVATLADPALDRPEVAGLVVWETPAGPQFANVELGTDPTVYTPGSCTLGDAGIHCPYPAEQLRWTDDTPVEICFDLDADDTCGRDDVAVHSTEDPLTGLRMLSPGLTADLLDAGADLGGYGDPAAADAWWAERDAARGAAALAARNPELAVLLVASEEDHIQRLADHPHVYGLGEAFQAAGVAWVRLNPGSAWLGGGPDNAPGIPLALSGSEARLLSEEDESPLPRTLAAAVRELADRAWGEGWSR